LGRLGIAHPEDVAGREIHLGLQLRVAVADANAPDRARHCLGALAIATRAARLLAVTPRVPALRLCDRLLISSTLFFEVATGSAERGPMTARWTGSYPTRFAP